MHASGKLILRLCGGVCNKQRRRKVRVVVELDPGFCFMVNKPHECPDVPQLLKRFFLAPYTDPDAVATNFFRLVAVMFQNFVRVDFIKRFLFSASSMCSGLSVMRSALLLVVSPLPAVL